MQNHQPPKIPPLVPLGLHGLFVVFPTINPAVVFSVTLFAINPQFGTLLFLVLQKNQKSNLPTSQKRRLHFFFIC